MGALQFHEPTHTYTLSGARVPSVTQVLAPLYEFAFVRAHVLIAKQALGTAVHLACQLDDEGDLDESSIDPAVLPYLDSYRLFKSQKSVRVIAAEHQVYHPLHRYAGTLDLFADIDGERWLIDLKTPVVMNPAVALQTAAYREALSCELESDVLPRRGALQLKDDGKYRLHEFKDPGDWPVFVSMLTVFRWKEKQK